MTIEIDKDKWLENIGDKIEALMVALTNSNNIKDVEKDFAKLQEMKEEGVPVLIVLSLGTYVLMNILNYEPDKVSKSLTAFIEAAYYLLYEMAEQVERQ